MLWNLPLVLGGGDGGDDGGEDVNIGSTDVLVILLKVKLVTKEEKELSYVWSIRFMLILPGKPGFNASNTCKEQRL